MSSFLEKARIQARRSGTQLLIGLDPEPDKIPFSIVEKSASVSEAVFHFCEKVISLTESDCCGYKLNLAFFEALGPEGLFVFDKVRQSIPGDMVVIADAKRGDIGNTARKYASAFYDAFDCDAITVNPLMGEDSMSPFLSHSNKAAFFLVLTSNEGASDFLTRKLDSGNELSLEIAMHISRLLESESLGGTAGMVLGATQCAKWKPLLDALPNAPLLIPGIGAQGGSATDIHAALAGRKNWAMPVISRAILYAFNDSEINWEQQVQNAARKFAVEFSY
ncbi:MAG: orotidine-5'-phosphate decarboxylase [Balneolales bacterium]|nr:orotidine-5'-phosphate decarboxylase [Balneolales bacterium]